MHRLRPPPVAICWYIESTSVAMHQTQGRGNRSAGGMPRLKPAMTKLLEKRGMHVVEDALNPGVLRVEIPEPGPFFSCTIC
jgi:hypothetical protein